MTIEIPRRRFLIGLGALVAAPAIVRASSLMPVRCVPDAYWRDGPIFVEDGLGNQFESYVSYFRWAAPPLVKADWRYVAKVVNWKTALDRTDA